MRFLPNGLGGSGGDRLVVNKPVYMSGDVRYVSSARGFGSSDGSSYESPVLTLAAAFALSANDDVIVLASDHNEILTAKVTLNKRITIVGEGSRAGKPMAQLQNNQAGDDMILVSSSNVDIRNVYFKTNAQANSGCQVRFTGQKFFRMSGCYFEAGENEFGGTLLSAASATAAQYVTLEQNKFVCISTAVDGTLTRYNQTTLVDVQDLVMRDCTFDGGTVGFEASGTTNIALTIQSGIAGSKNIYIEGLNLLRGADVTVTDATVTGYLNTGTTTGANRIFW